MKINRLAFIPPASPWHKNGLSLTVKLSCVVSTEGALSWGSELGGCVRRGAGYRDFMPFPEGIIVH